MAEKSYDLEAVYDEQIFPLMKQIIEISKQNNMPFVASFQFASDGEDEHDFCSSANLPKDRCIAPQLDDIYGILTRRGPAPLNLTVRNKDGQVTEMIAILP